MDAVIRKWGNSPAVRINAAAMKAAAFDLEQRVTIKASRGRIVIEPADKLELKLEDLVAGISRQNVHEAADFGAPAGKEAL
jgi:antitoxin MazE